MVYKTHVGVYAVIIESNERPFVNNRILLITKSRGPYTGLLDLPGGRPEHGEDMITALKREIFEETGYTLHAATLFDIFTTVVEYEEHGEQRSLYHIGIIYSVTVIHENKVLVVPSEDMVNYDWYDYALLKQEQLSPFAKNVIEK